MAQAPIVCDVAIECDHFSPEGIFTITRKKARTKQEIKLKRWNLEPLFSVLCGIPPCDLFFRWLTYRRFMGEDLWMSHFLTFLCFWRQRTFCGTWSIFDRLIVFVETSSMNDFFTVVNSENSWFWGISKLAYYEGISYRALSSCTASQFLTFDVKGFFTALDAFLTGYNFLLKLILRMIFSEL